LCCGHPACGAPVALETHVPRPEARFAIEDYSTPSVFTVGDRRGAGTPRLAPLSGKLGVNWHTGPCRPVIGRFTWENPRHGGLPWCTGGKLFSRRGRLRWRRIGHVFCSAGKSGPDRHLHVGLQPTLKRISPHERRPRARVAARSFERSVAKPANHRRRWCAGAPWR